MENRGSLSHNAMTALAQTMLASLNSTLLSLPHNNTGDGKFNMTEMFNIAIAFNTLLLNPARLEELKNKDPQAIEVMKDFCASTIATCKEFLEKN